MNIMEMKNLLDEFKTHSLSAAARGQMERAKAWVHAVELLEGALQAALGKGEA